MTVMAPQSEPDGSVFCDSSYDRRKLLYHPQVIADLLRDGDVWPVTVNTGFTTYCNHSCVWCSSAYTTRVEPSLKRRDQLLIDPDVWIPMVTSLAGRGTRGLIVAGQGEPLLHPAAKEMLDAVAQSGMRFMIFTNGQRLHERYFDSLFAGAVAARFSVDAATEVTHTKWHAADTANGKGRADFAQVVGNIRALVNEKKRRGSRFPHIGCQMICSRLTESDFEEFAALFSSIGVDYIAYKSLQGNLANRDISVSSFDLHDSDEERQAQASQMVETLLDIKRRYETPAFQVHVKVDQIRQAYTRRFNDAVRYDRCRAHPLTPMVEPDGKVYLCIDHGGNDEFVIGNIYEDPIERIWASQRRRDVIARIDLKQKCPAGCFLDDANAILHRIANPDPDHHAMLI